MRTAKAQISLRIRAVWLGPSLSANRIIGHYRMYQWIANDRVTWRMRGMNLNLCILRMHEDTVLLGVAHIRNVRCMRVFSKSNENTPRNQC